MPHTTKIFHIYREVSPSSSSTTILFSSQKYIIPNDAAYFVEKSEQVETSNQVTLITLVNSLSERGPLSTASLLVAYCPPEIHTHFDTLY